jgi:hypothetical protein
MACVDLNPIRAKIAKTPGQCEHTSIQQRIKKPSTHSSPVAEINNQKHCSLLPVIPKKTCLMTELLRYAFLNFCCLCLFLLYSYIALSKVIMIHDSI